MDKKLVSSIVVIILFVGAFLVFNKYVFRQNNGAQNNMTNTQNSNIEVIPIEHATMVLKWNNKVIFVDPVGGAIAFSNQPTPDLILLTHAHSDHFSAETLQAVAKDNTLIIAPMAVADLVPNTIAGTLLVAKNGQKTNQQGFKIEAVPAYNFPESADSYHQKGEDNGYVLEVAGERIYISGDTSNTPELRQLKNIDLAFVSMNLPYTMSVEQAAEAVLQFKPKKVYPYHYRGPDGLSDVAEFQKLVNKKNPNIEVVQLDWYPRS